jgi:alanine dehydrogenase
VALNNATLPFTLQLAEKGFPRALAENAHLAQGLNVFDGRVVHPAVAQAVGEPALLLAAALAG